MTTFVQQTLEAIDQKIAALTQLSAQIRSVLGSAAPEPTPAGPIVKAAPVKVARAARPPRGDSATVIAIARHIKEPFSAADLGAAVDGLKAKAASNYIMRWKAKGWIASTGTLGQYQRTKTFGGPSQQSQDMLKQIHKEIATGTEE